MPAVGSGEKENAANQTRNVMNKRGARFRVTRSRQNGRITTGEESLLIICGKTQVSKVTRLTMHFRPVLSEL